jgi:hypothetical protein
VTTIGKIRILVDCLLWAVFLKITEVVRHFGLLLSMVKAMNWIKKRHFFANSSGQTDHNPHGAIKWYLHETALLTCRTTPTCRTANWGVIWQKRISYPRRVVSDSPKLETFLFFAVQHDTPWVSNSCAVRHQFGVQQVGVVQQVSAKFVFCVNRPLRCPRTTSQRNNPKLYATNQADDWKIAKFLKQIADSARRCNNLA